MPITDIKELRILPSLAIGRLGSSPEPMDNYDVEEREGKEFRQLVPRPTLNVDRATGRIVSETTPEALRFRDAGKKIRPVAPFLEVWARFEDGGPLEALTAGNLQDLGLDPSTVRWRVHVGNIKAFRRTGDAADRIEAVVEGISDHAVRELHGTAGNFRQGASILLGSVQYLQPTTEFPEIRLRFTPAAGKVFGGRTGDRNIAAAVYDQTKGGWDNHFDGDPNAPFQTIPGGIYAGTFNSQTQTFRSLGYLDDSCDGIVEVEIAVQGRTLGAFARISSGPPDFAPDSFHPRTVADDLEQMLFGPDVAGPVAAEEVISIVRRALDTVHLMNTEVMNGNQRVGGVSMNSNNMAGHDQGNGRAFEPIFDPATVDALAVRGFHRTVLDGLRLGAPPGFVDILRPYNEVGQLTNAGRRRMPGMMRGSDGLHLALTRRQRNKVRVAGEPPPVQTGGGPEQEMVTLIQHFSAFAGRHTGIDTGGGHALSELFGDPPAVLAYLRRGKAQGSLAGDLEGRPLVVPGDPAASAFFAIIQKVGHPMKPRFAGEIPGTGKTGVEIVRQWIASLT
jgi:hypothetical protein